MTDPETLRQLRADLQDSERFMRLDAIQQLARLKTPQAIPGLMDGLCHSDSFIVNIAEDGLVNQQEAALPCLLEHLQQQPFSIKKRILNILARIESAEAVPSILLCLADKDTRIVLAALAALGAIGDTRALQPLMALLDHPSAELHLPAIEAVATIGGRDSVPYLAQALSHHAPVIRRQAALGLADIGSEAVLALPALIQCLYDQVGDVRATATNALAMLGHPAYSALVDMLAEGSTAERVVASRALIGIGEPTLDELTAAFNDDDHKLAVTCAVILSEMGEMGIPILLKGLASASDITRHAAMVALDNVPDPRAQAALEDYRKQHGL